MNPISVWIDRYLKRLAWGQFLQRSADLLAVFLFVLGAAVLVVKLLLPAFWPHVLWLALSAVPVALAAWLLSQRNRFTRTESVAMLDRRLNAGGLLMTLAETPDDRWGERLPQVAEVWQNGLPKIRPVRFARCLSLPLVFAVGACFVPLREAQPEPVLPNVVGQQASQELEELLDWMKDAEVLDEEEQRQLQEEIERLAAETEDKPLTHEKWETVDALRERMQMRLDSAALTAAKAHEAVAALAKAGGDGPELSLDRIMQLEQDLVETLQKMGAQGAFSGATSDLRGDLERLLKNRKLPDDPEQLNKLLNDLDEFLDQELEKLNELREKCDCKDGKCPHCGGPQQGGT